MQILCSVSLQGTQDLGASLVSHLQSKIASTYTAGTCSATAQEKEDAAQVVQRLINDKAAGAKVLVVCGDAAGSLEDEVKDVVTFSKAFSAAFGSHMTACVSDTSAQVWNRGCFAEAPHLLFQYVLKSDSSPFLCVSN